MDEQAEVRREVVLPLSRDEAWEAISDPAELERWLADEAELEPEPGADVTFRWDGGAERHGVVEEVEPAERLALRWWDVDDPGAWSRVELTLDDAPGGTRLIVVETALVAVARAQAARAWGLRLSALAASGALCRA